MKTSFCKYGAYHIERANMWGTYCPETGEYYLASYDEESVKKRDREYVTRVTCWYDKTGYLHVYSERGYSYQVVRELLQLGHLTRKTLAEFIEAGGEVWWNQ